MIFWVALRKELLEQWRSYRLLMVAAVLLFFGLTSPLLARYTPDLLKMAIPDGLGQQLVDIMPAPSKADAVAQYLNNLSEFGILLALLMAMGAVAQEKDKGTAALMLVTPMPRGVFLAAKFAALALTFTASVALAGVACYYYTLLLFGPLDLLPWLGTNGLLLVSLLVYIALTLLCSTLTRSQVIAGGLSFGVLILLSALGAIPQVGDFLPGRLIAWAGALAKGAADPAWPALWTGAGLIIVGLLAAWWALERQEL